MAALRIVKKKLKEGINIKINLEAAKAMTSVVLVSNGIYNHGNPNSGIMCKIRPNRKQMIKWR